MLRSIKLGLLTLLMVAQILMINPSGLSAQDDKDDLNELFQSASDDISSGDTKSGEVKLLKYTKKVDDNLQAWFLLGYSLHLNGKLDEAIKAHKRAAADPQFGPIALFNLGCAYSLKNEPKKSVEYLHQCLDAGFNQFDNFDEDADLVNVRKSDAFKEILARATNGGARVEPTGIKNLIGQWVIKSGTRQGTDIEKERLPPVITFTEKDVTIPTGDDKFVMSYKIVDDSEDVIKIDFKIESGPAPEGNAKAILKIKGNKAKLCYDPTGAKRPEKFETTEENGCFLFVMEKKVQKNMKNEKNSRKRPSEDDGSDK